jgi:hypothetical protein
MERLTARAVHVHVPLGRGRGEVRAGAGVDDDVRTHVDLETLGGVEAFQGGVAHEEERVAVGLRTGAEAGENAADAVVAVGEARVGLPVESHEASPDESDQMLTFR